MRILTVVFFTMAVLSSPLTSQTRFELHGDVVDAKTNLPVAGARVSLAGGLADHDAVSTTSGYYTLLLAPAVAKGTLLRLYAQKEGYEITDEEFGFTLVPQRLFLKPRIVSEQDETTRLIFDLGNQMSSNQKFHEARDAYTRVLVLNHDYGPAFRERCYVNVELGRFQEAAADCTQAIKRDPENYQPYANRGRAYDVLGEQLSAITDLNKALSLHPNDPTVLNNRALAYRHLGCYDRAEHDFDLAIRFRQRFYLYLANRGALLVALGRFDPARVDLEEAASLEPDHPGTHFSLGQVYFAEKKYDLAIREFNRAIAHNADHAAAYFERGRARDKLGDVDGAAADRSTAKSRNYKPPLLQPPLVVCPDR